MDIHVYNLIRVLLYDKLEALAKSGGLEKIRGDEKLSHGISGLLNAMSELSELAKKNTVWRVISTTPCVVWPKSWI